MLTGKPPQPAAEHAGFEPAASSSRSQVTVWTVSAAACLTWERPVRQCPLAFPAVGWRLLLTWLLSSGRLRRGHLDANYRRVR